MSRFALLLLGAWLLVATALGSLLLASHAPLPLPRVDDAKLRAAFGELLGDVQGWRAVHVLYRSCACSRRVLAHLRAGRRAAGVHDTVLLVDDEAAPDVADEALRASGVRVEVIGREALAQRFGLEAAPTLVLLRPDGSVAYLGGYTRSKQGTLEHEQIVAALRAESPASRLPVLGCATSARLTAALDPLGLRRW